MEASIFIAKLIGPLFVVVGIGIIANPEYYSKLVDETRDNPTMIYFSGVLSLLAGITIVIFHNVWSLQWHLLITLMGWTSIIKGAARIMFPTRLSASLREWIKRPVVMKISAGIIMLIGLYLTYRGFVV